MATMLEKLRFQRLVEETLTVKRATRAMPMYQFVLAMVMRCTGDSEGVAAAARAHFLAGCGLAAWECGATT